MYCDKENIMSDKPIENAGGAEESTNTQKLSEADSTASQSDEQVVFAGDEGDDEEVVFAGEESSNISSSSQEVVFYNASASGERPSKPAIPRTPAAAQASGEKKKGTKINSKKFVLRVVAVIMGVIMMLSGSACVIVYSYMSRINYEAIGGDSSVESSEAPIKASSSTKKESSSATNVYSGDLLTDDQILNVLLIGADTRKNQTHGNSDSMILMSVDTKSKKLKLVSFMRDTFVAIPGFGNNKLTASFSIGGADLTVRTIQANYGIRIDRYAVVDFNSFRNIIDTMGGIDIELSQEEVDYIDWQCWKNKQVETRHELNADSYTYNDMIDGEAKTMVHLNGRQALWHSRNRGEDGICSGDDYVRTQRQRNVIGIILDMMKHSDIQTVMNIIYAIGPMITTNLKTSEIAGLATNIKKYLSYQMLSTSAPTYDMIGQDYYYSDEQHPIYIGGYLVSCIVIIDWDAFRTKVADFVFNDKEAFNDPNTMDEQTSSSE